MALRAPVRANNLQETLFFGNMAIWQSRLCKDSVKSRTDAYQQLFILATEPIVENLGSNIIITVYKQFKSYSLENSKYGLNIILITVYKQADLIAP